MERYTLDHISTICAHGTQHLLFVCLLVGSFKRIQLSFINTLSHSLTLSLSLSFSFCICYFQIETVYISLLYTLNCIINNMFRGNMSMCAFERQGEITIDLYGGDEYDKAKSQTNRTERIIVMENIYA